MSAAPIKKSAASTKVNKNDKEPNAAEEKKGWKEKLVDLIGQRCCWNLNDDCCEDCKNVWRCWISLASFYTMIFSVFEFAFMVHLFLPYSDNEAIFSGDKMKKLFILNDNMYPVWTLSTTVTTFCLSVWSLIFAIQPDKGKSKALIAYKLISSVVVLGCFVLSIVQIVLCIIEWPDTKYKLELERVMRNDMEFGRPPDLIRKSWVDTQDAFQCCGIYSWFDWSNKTRSQGYDEGDRELDLPLSCCAYDIVEDGYCTESKVWKIGCLEEQVYEMKTYSLFNTVFIYILYFLTNWLSLSIQKYYKKFPVRDVPDEEAPESKDEKINSNTRTTPNPSGKSGSTPVAQASRGKPVNKKQVSEPSIANVVRQNELPKKSSSQSSQTAAVQGAKAKSLPPQESPASATEDDDGKVLLEPRKWSKTDV